MGIPIKVYSYGGSGCTALRQALGIPNHAGDKHARKPPKLRPGFKVAYIAGNPMNAVLSFFGRQKPGWNFPTLHGGNLGVRINPSITLESFVRGGVDLFKLGEHVDNWVCGNRGYPVLFIRYETMHSHLAEISAWFSRKCILEEKKRKSDWTTQPKHIREGLERIYGELWMGIRAIGEISVV